MADEIRRVLEPLVPADEPVAMVDFPNHANVGDAAIWLGQRAWARHSGRDVAYTCEVAAWSPRALRRTLGARGTIMLQGGGNLGDAWPARQAFREAVLADCSRYRVVQFSQSLNFRETREQDRVGAALRAHADFTVLCRDDVSLTCAREELGLRAEKCPDMAFALGALARPARSPTADVLWLGRTDSERELGDDPIPREGTLTADWIDHKGRLESALSAALPTVGSRVAERLPGVWRPLSRGFAAGYDRAAAEALKRGVALLTSASAVATDRLHAHVLCTLLGVPHAVTDTGYGKLTRFRESWPGLEEDAVWADSPQAAVDSAVRLAAEIRDA